LCAEPYYQTGDGVTLSGVTYGYDEHSVLSEYSLTIAPGEKVLIIGPNGAGKTTLANILAGYLAPQQGACVLPKRISAMTLPLAFPPLKVKALVADAALLSTLGLADLAEDPAEALSAGQRQKLAVALALSQAAELYVFDEPFASVDTESVPVVLETILAGTAGKTVVVIMHGSPEVYGRFDRVIELTPTQVAKRCVA
jgi:ABC-type Mn2+/Zn2+ transport system ATPase subunit